MKKKRKAAKMNAMAKAIYYNKKRVATYRGIFGTPSNPPKWLRANPALL